MKRLLASALLAVGLMTAPAMAETVKVGIDVGPYPPFTVPDANGKWGGWEIELMEAVCKEAGLTCEVTPTAWDGIIPALNGNQIDMIMSSMSITEEREKVIDFTNHYYKTPASIVVAKGSGITPDVAGLTGKIVGVQAATSHASYVEKYFRPVAAEVKTYQTADETYQDLAAGRVDAVQGDSLAIADFIKSEAGAACCEIAGNVQDDPAILGRGVGIGLRKDSPLKERLNAAIAKVIADGTHEALTKKYFNISIYQP